MNWPYREIKEVARVVGGATPRSGEASFWDGEISWITPKDLANLDGKFIADTPRKITDLGLKSCSSEMLPVGSVLFSSRAPIGHIAINTVPIATNQGFKSFVPGPELDASYLYWWLDANRERLQAMGNGATFKEVSKAVVERVVLPVPPLPEQQRLAEIMDRAGALRRMSRDANKQALQLLPSVFSSTFSNAVAEAKPGVKLMDLVDRTRGISYGIVQRGQDLEDGIPVVRIGDFVKGVLTGQSLKKTSPEISSKYKRTVLRGGELVISIRGTVGKVAIVPDSLNGANVSREVAVIPLLPSVSPSFILSYLRSEAVQRKIVDDVRGVAQSGINLEHLRQLPVPRFSDAALIQFEKQAEICAQVEQRFRSSFKRMNALFTSLQHRAFNGEL